MHQTGYFDLAVRQLRIIEDLPRPGGFRVLVKILPKKRHQAEKLHYVSFCVDPMGFDLFDPSFHEVAGFIQALAGIWNDALGLGL